MSLLLTFFTVFCSLFAFFFSISRFSFGLFAFLFIFFFHFAFSFLKTIFFCFLFFFICSLFHLHASPFSPVRISFHVFLRFSFIFLFFSFFVFLWHLFETHLANSPHRFVTKTRIQNNTSVGPFFFSVAGLGFPFFSSFLHCSPFCISIFSEFFLSMFFFFCFFIFPFFFLKSFFEFLFIFFAI